MPPALPTPTWALHACWSPSRPARHAGHYAHGVREHGAASAHFRAVLHSDATQLHDAAAAAAALVELEGDPAGPAGLRAALELLKSRGLQELPHALALPVHDRWAGTPGWPGRASAGFMPFQACWQH